MEPKESFASDTSCHGIKFASNAKTPLARILWAVAICTCAGFMCLVQFYNIRDFVNSPSVTSIEVTEQRPMTVKLPDVLLCPMNNVHGGRARALGLNSTLVQHLFQTYLAAGPASSPSLDEELTAHMKRSGMGVMQVLAEIGPRCEDMLTALDWFGNPMDVCNETRTVVTIATGDAEVCMLVQGLGMAAWTGEAGGARLVLANLSTLTHPLRTHFRRNGIKIAVHKFYNPFKVHTVVSWGSC